MTHPIELAASRVISDLRLDHAARHEDGALHLAKGAYFSWDTANGSVHLDVAPEFGALLHLSATLDRTPDWFSFNIELGEASLAAGEVIGLAIEFRGCAGETLPLFLRTSRDGVLSDTWLKDKLQGSPDRATQVLLHPLQAFDPAVGEAGYHTLVLPLPKRNFSLELRDLRLFVVPAERKMQIGPQTLGIG